MSGSSAPRQEAEMNANLIGIWLATPTDGSGTLLFINQNSAISWQNDHSDATVIAGLGITTQNENDQNVQNVDAIGDSTYPVTGGQAPKSTF